MAAVLEVNDLVKDFAAVRAVDGVSFTVGEGTCFGLLGPNGAGKTTTIEIMEGIATPSAGQVLYRGKPLGGRFRREAGIQFQTTALQEFLTVRDQLRLFRNLYERGLTLQELVEICALSSFLDRDARKLSGGQRQRLLLAIALVNDPEIVFLDEPTTGLDPQARRNFWDVIRHVKARHKTVLLTTHYMEEAYLLCDEIVIMDHGKIIAQGSPKSLLAEHFHDVILELPRSDFSVAQASFPFPVLQTDTVIEIPTDDVNGVIEALLARRISLARLRIRPRTLEDLFLELTGKELRP